MKDIFNNEAVVRGKERYGASESPGYEESSKIAPHSQNQGEQGYSFEPQGQSSIDHWGGRSEAMTEDTISTDKDGWSSKERVKGMDSSKDITLHDDIEMHNTYPGLEKIENPGDVDEGIWKKAKAASEKEYGAGHWAVTSYLYKKMGGKFHKK
jgi:hypothetical protein